MIKFAIKIRYLNEQDKWKQHTTKWYEDLSDAWTEADAYADSVNYL